jgi:hypothetical protein
MSNAQLVSLEPQCLEVYVDMDTPNPEFVLFDNIAQWLAEQEERYPILGTNIYYESQYGRIYALVTLGTSLPLVNVEEL